MAIINRMSRIPSRPSISSCCGVAALSLKLPPSYRAFHASPRPQFLDTVMLTSYTFLESIHTFTGLSWAYSLPLAALTIRTTIVLPLAIYGRRALQKQAELSPLIMAWQPQFQKESMSEVGHMGPKATQSTLLKKTRQKRDEIYKRWGCGLWKNYASILQLPIWLTFIETIRAMCGTRKGLLGLCTSAITSEDASDSTVGAVVSVVPVEASFATEGALWFPNLLVPDPELFLPFMLSGCLFLSVSNLSGKVLNQSVFQRRFTNAFKVAALVIGPLTLQIPSAMLVYWISSSSIAILQGLILDKVMPLKSPISSQNAASHKISPLKDGL